MDDGKIIELRGGRGRRRMDIPAGQAPVMRLTPRSQVVVDDVQLVFHEEGPFIILTVDRWQRTLAKAIVNSAVVEAEEEQAVRRTRQVRRQIQRDSKN
jgi:hypothetical protein